MYLTNVNLTKDQKQSIEDKSKKSESFTDISTLDSSKNSWNLLQNPKVLSQKKSVSKTKDWKYFHCS